MSPWLTTLLQVFTVTALGTIATLAGSPLVKATFRLVNRGAAEPEQAHPTASTTVLRGGAWIGRLERLSIFAGLVCAYPEAIAICLAMKGLARYPELKAPSSGAAEAFIIGTFVSVLWACGCAGLAI